MAAVVPFSEVERLDAELVRLARGGASLRLEVGAALERLAACGGHHELGFSSMDAYARERCERSGRWAADSRALARRSANLPRISRALRSGVIGWSTAELLARHVTAESEGEWLERAQCATVRELRRLLVTANPGDRESRGTWIERVEQRTVKHLREEVCDSARTEAATKTRT